MTKTTLLSPEDHSRISAAVAAAELHSDGEIAVMAARHSDDYAEWAMLLAAIVALSVPAFFALMPGYFSEIVLLLTGSWHDEPTLAATLVVLALAGALKFVSVWLVLRWTPLRLLLTPAFVKRSRVRDAALRAYRIGIESRTRAATGVLVYLSLAEHRAEIVADAAITERVGVDAWGEAMTLLLGGVRDGCTADGIVAAVQAIGVLLAQHFPRSEDDSNELPDRLIEL
jgi:putative membrane protein